MRPIREGDQVRIDDRKDECHGFLGDVVVVSEHGFLVYIADIEDYYTYQENQLEVIEEK